MHTTLDSDHNLNLTCCLVSKAENYTQHYEKSAARPVTKIFWTIGGSENSGVPVVMWWHDLPSP